MSKFTKTLSNQAFMHNWKRFSTDRRIRILVVIVILILILQPRFSSHYNNIKRIDIPDFLVTKHTKEMEKIELKQCSYDVLYNEALIEIPKPDEPIMLVNDRVDFGQYVPEDCRPTISTAILVPYRNRKKHLDLFIPYMHNFLKEQKIHYRIFVIEQADSGPWNKGKLFNTGVRIAKELGFPCVVLHDVDMLPLNPANLFACTTQPRHMSPCIDKFRYNLPYNSLIGGALAILTEQYIKVNGFSNKFELWGGEDDDLYNRILHERLTIFRFPPDMSKYTMIVHMQEAINSNRIGLIVERYGKYKTDGYTTLTFKNISVMHQKLYTNISVHL